MRKSLILLVFVASVSCVSLAWAQTPACVPRSTFLTSAKLTWELTQLDAVTPPDSTIAGFVLERKQDQQPRWTVLRDDLPPTTLDYLDTDLRPKRTYEWQLRAKLVNNAGETALSQPFTQGPKAPCLRVVELPPPGTLQAEPVLP